MSRIVIIGSGFAALTAVRTLRRQGGTDKIVLVAPKPELFYYPSLIWVPAGLRKEADLRIPLEKFLLRNQVEYHPGRVSGLDPKACKITLEKGEVEYDQLIIASGARFIKKLPGIEHIYTPCEGYEATRDYTLKLNQLEGGTLAFGFSGNPKEPAAMRGGPMFEFLFGVDTLLRRQKRRDKFDLVFFSPAPQPGKRLGEKAVAVLLGEMEKRGVQTHLGHKLKGFEADKIITEGGDVYSDLTLFMPGMTGPAWAGNSGLPLSDGGFFLVDPHCRVPGFDNIYVAGDSGSFSGPDWMPKQAHMADLQAEAAVKNLLAVQRGGSPTHGFKVELVCIVDSLDNGVLIYRSPQRSVLLRQSLFHWSKRFFEWWYLRHYR